MASVNLQSSLSARVVGARDDNKQFHEELVTDKQVAQELGGVRPITIWRWTKDSNLGFPPAVKINNRNYRRRSDIEAFKLRMFEQAVTSNKTEVAL